MQKKNILLCVAGGTPQVITETLWALVIEKGIKIDEVRVITTLDGEDKIVTGSINGFGSPEQSLLYPEKGQFYKFIDDYQLDNKIKFDRSCIEILEKDRLRLKDIRSVEENEIAGNQICDYVRELCGDENIKVFASAAGGRKTMSIYLTVAMQLFGRSDDSLSHVLVNKDFEGNLAPYFFYPPPPSKDEIIELRDGRKVSTKDAKIYLAEIPFVRLKGNRNALTLEDKQSYINLVDQAQIFLDAKEKDHSLEINLFENTVKVGGLEVRISDYELLLFTLFANKKLDDEGDNKDGFVYFKSLTKVDFERAFKRIIEKKEDEKILLNEEFLLATEWEFLLTVVKQCESVLEKDYDDFMNSVSRAIGRGNKKLRNAGFPKKYEITSKGDARPKMYGLTIPGEQIEFVSEELNEFI